MSAYTEEEARQKWCPFVRVSNGPDGSWNRFEAGHVSDRECYACIGSRCMAWRKVAVNEGTPYLPEWKNKGYCGLAGAPQ